MARTMTAGSDPQSTATLPAWGAGALSVQGLLLVSASFVLPAAAHLAGLPVRLLLPMHWPILLIGLCYGWRSGLIAGLAAPGLAYLISGMPYPPMIPPMTIELAAYGFLAGFLRQQLGWHALFATLGACVGGRLVFIAVVAATGAATTPFLAYLGAAMVPGLAAAIAQVILLPPLANWWVSRQAQK